jgi:hypothetical protein
VIPFYYLREWQSHTNRVFESIKLNQLLDEAKFISNPLSAKSILIVKRILIKDLKGLNEFQWSKITIKKSR